MNANVNAINWFEIAVTDMARAKKFHETIFDIEMYDLDYILLKTGRTIDGLRRDWLILNRHNSSVENQTLGVHSLSSSKMEHDGRCVLQISSKRLLSF